MEVERRVSGRFVEWLFGAARGEPVSGLLREAGLDLEAVSLDYPAERVPQWLSLLSSSLHPGQSPAEALRRTGFDAVRKVQPGQSLEQVMTELPRKLESLGNFFDVSVRAHGSHRYVAHFDDVNFLPTFFLGVLQGVTSASCTRPLEVVWSPEGLSGARYEVAVKASS
jgi:uncharacterized protein (TIGR02265 family)